ncbi:MAG: HYD1 signature containing ADP-ribosyltransferase family protein, partial [Cyanobacteriota bacterium]|nr:HYD1 signature containing ADP-ribosyltransferase family protein [Cyanobacteriota bacterium]
KKAVNFIYDKLRKAVKFIFEAAKKLAMAAIDLARNIIVGIIKALGEILKGLVQVVFAAFPEISKKFTNAIDSAVNKATEIVNAAADFLQKAVSTVLDFLANTLDTLLGLVQSLYNGIFTVIGMLIRGEFAELIKGFGNLIEGAKEMPPQFETAALEELMGDDLDQPLSPEVIAQAQQAGIAIPGMTGENTPPINQASEMPSAPWSEENVGVDAVENNMELSPELIAELMQQTQGDGEVTLAESQDKSRSMESIVSEAGGQQQAVGKQEAQIPDDGLSPRQRAGIKWELMKQGIKQWFSDNWPILLAGFIAAAAVIIAAIVATGGAVLAALPAIMQVLAVVFAAELIATIGGHMRDYMSKAWEGDIQGGGKSLAKALAAGAIELIFELIPVLGKAIKKGVRAVGKGAKAVFKGGTKLAKTGRLAVAKGAKYTIQKGKVLFKGIAGSGIGKRAKSLSNLGEEILNKTRFNKAKIKVSKNGELEIKGCINPCNTVGKGTTSKVPESSTSNATNKRKSVALEKESKRTKAESEIIPDEIKPEYAGGEDRFPSIPYKGKSTKLIHYTDEEGLKAILESKKLNLSTGKDHARYGDGQYFTDLLPENIGGKTVRDLTKNQKDNGMISAGQAAQKLFNDTRLTRKMTHYIEIDISKLKVRQGLNKAGTEIRENVQFILNYAVLNLDGLIVRSGESF